MSTTSRKQREIRQREQMLLDVGRRILIDRGFAGLSLDHLAEATEYSRGTVYQHFSTKEDLVTALAVQSNELRIALFGRARHFAGRPRERMLALGVADELFARLRPHYFQSELVVRMANLDERATPARRETLLGYEDQIGKWVRETVQEAVDQGDLQLATAVTPGRIAFAVFSMAIGGHTAMANARLLARFELSSPFEAMHGNMAALLDGFDWKPLSQTWDYEATLHRVLQTVFPEESRQLGPA
jgi:AcrR family transcriptional regulator